jgi:hypothetical protein
MFKKILGGIAVLGIVAVIAANVILNSQKSDLSMVSLANIEALATSEGGCNSCSYKWTEEIQCSLGGGSYRTCNDNGTGNSCSSGGSSTCTCGVNCLPKAV